MGNHQNRRQFLKQFTLLAGASYFLPQFLLAQKWASMAGAAALPEFSKVGRGKKVLVLGGGVSGLCAAYELERAGYQVQVLERSHRVGGRVMTLRGFFEDQHVELGATRLPDSHFLTHGYIEKFGLKLAEYPGDAKNNLYSMDGRMFKSADIEAQGYPEWAGVRSDEKNVHPDTLRDRIIRKGFSFLGDAEKEQALDQLTLQAWVDRQAEFSPGAKRIHKVYQGSEVDVYNAWAWLELEKRDEKWNRTYALASGNDQLAEAFASRLQDKIVKFAQVKKVSTTQKGVFVTAEQQGKQVIFEGEYCVCALPHKILNEIVWEPGLPELKVRASKEIPMQSVTRVNLQFKKRFWNEEEKLRGLLVACADSPIERLLDMTCVQSGKSGVLAAYIQSKNVDVLESQGASTQKKLYFALDQVGRLFPQARREYVKGMLWEWGKQKESHGAWTAPKPGQKELFQSLQASIPRVAFAGDGVSVYSGWIQGALETAHLAVLELERQNKST